MIPFFQLLMADLIELYSNAQPCSVVFMVIVLPLFSTQINLAAGGGYLVGELLTV